MSEDVVKKERETVVGPNEFNEKVIKEFRENDGVVGPPFEGAPLLLLTTTGAKTHQLRTTPLVYLRDAERYVIFASAAGSDKHPSWFHNIVANPRVTVEIGTEKFEADASITQNPEREELYERQSGLRPDFAKYKQATKREIPVIALTQI